MFLRRTLSTKIEQLRSQFPVLAVLGPRQSGKTTLVKKLFSDYEYVNLEELDTRLYAKEDPRRFLRSFLDKKGVILDEIQHVPEILSYIQAQVDLERIPGFFILTGSQNILINEHISQTLAGRIAIATLLPLTIEELKREEKLPSSLEQTLFQGFYPSVYREKMISQDWYANYIQTYIERDVRQIKNITDLSLFQKFLKLCAGRTGQLLNLTSLGNDCGISTNTARSWLTLLEACYIVFLVYPHHQNFSKRVIKMPKLYFYDTGIASYLLEIQSEKTLLNHYLRGGLFESMQMADLLKRRYNHGLQPNIYFWRDKTEIEIDCIIEKGKDLFPVEMKSGETIHSDFFDGLVKWNAFAKQDPSRSFVIYGGNKNQTRSEGHIVGWNHTETIPIV